MLEGENNLTESKLITWSKEKRGEFPCLLLFWHKSPYSCEDNLSAREKPVAVVSRGRQISLKLGRECTLDSFLIFPFTNACVLYLWRCACHLIKEKKNASEKTEFSGVTQSEDWLTSVKGWGWLGYRLCQATFSWWNGRLEKPVGSSGLQHTDR